MSTNENNNIVQSDKTSSDSDNEQLIGAVRVQVEYYFSKENLRTDSYLLSQMDGQGAVPLAVVMKFAKLLSLTQDETVVRKALETSQIVNLTDDKIRSVIPKVTRSTIILREIPSDAPEEEVRAIFLYDGAKPVTSIRSEIGDTWFVTMESEDDAKDAILDIKLKKRSFRGEPVKARLKSEAAVKSYYNGAANILAPPFLANMPVPPFNGYARQAGDSFNNYSDKSGENSPDYIRNRDSKNPRNNQNESAKTGGNERTKSPGAKDAEGNNRSKNDRNDRSRGGYNNNNRNNTRNEKGNDKKGGRGKDVNNMQPIQPPIEINALNFPPLPGDESHSSATANPNISNIMSVAATSSQLQITAPPYVPSRYILAPGQNVKAYSIDDIINIVKNIQDAPLPGSIKTHEHPLAMSTTPNVDLLLRQRTFSIDETREQMQLGRPVLREAISGGAVDYRSMMCGDESDSPSTSIAIPAVAVNTQNKGVPTVGSWAGVLMKSGTPPTPTKEIPITQSKGAKATHQDSKSAPIVSTVNGATPTSNTPTPKPAGNNAPKKAETKASESKQKSEKADKSDNKVENKDSSVTAPKKGDKKEKNKSDKKKGESKDAAPSSWGGKPTFATVLKQAELAQSEVDLKSVAVPTNTEPTTSVPKANPNPQGNQGKNNNRGKSGANQNNKNNSEEKSGGASAATWVKVKLDKTDSK